MISLKLLNKILTNMASRKDLNTLAMTKNNRQRVFDNMNNSNSDSQPDNEIWYFTSNEEITPLASNPDFGATFISNTYVNNKGIIKCAGAITKIPYNTFNTASLKYISIPKTVTVISLNNIQDIASARFCGTVEEWNNVLAEGTSSVYIVCSNGVNQLAYKGE